VQGSRPKWEKDRNGSKRLSRAN